MASYWNKSYNELPKGFYTAEVRDHVWDGYYLFRAYPDRGTCCLEYVSTNLQEVLDRAEAFSHGVKDSAIYSASY